MSTLVERVARALVAMAAGTAHAKPPFEWEQWRSEAEAVIREVLVALAVPSEAMLKCGEVTVATSGQVNPEDREAVDAHRRTVEMASRIGFRGMFKRAIAVFAREHGLALPGTAPAAIDTPAAILADAQRILFASLPPDGPSDCETISALLGLLDGPRCRGLTLPAHLPQDAAEPASPTQEPDR